jgi:hypothetical protein
MLGKRMGKNIGSKIKVILGEILDKKLASLEI